MSAAKAKRPNRTGRMRKLHCDCGTIAYMSAGAIRAHGAPLCAQCRQPLALAYGADAVAAGREQALRYAVERQERRDEQELAEHGLKVEREAKRAERADLSGFKTRAANCQVCGRFKSKPADECDYCGDIPTTVGEDARRYNRAYGYAA
jgi:hypothetical protein